MKTRDSSTLRPVLLAEDNPNDVELTVTALKEANFANEIVVVNDGEQALDFLFRRRRFADRADVPPAVVLLDLKMPKVDGHEVLRTVRADPVLGLLPIVILTSSREEADLVQGYGNGANAYVVKPVDFDEFIGAIRRLGIFWAILNEPPPLAAERRRPDPEADPRR
jgi:CheY-like chemotaxis protein